MDKQTSKKTKVAEVAAKRYVENNRFTIQSLADELSMKSADIFELFPNRKSILLFYYESRILAYRELIKSIEDYPKFSLGEKLSNFFFTLLDQFMENREFVLLSYNKLIARNPSPTAFEREFKNELQLIFQTDPNLAGSSRFFVNQILYISIYCQFHALILFWFRDESDKFEQSFALIDKWCTLTEEIFYSKIIDKGFDFGKFLFYNSPFKRAFSSYKSTGETVS